MTWTPVAPHHVQSHSIVEERPVFSLGDYSRRKGVHSWRLVITFRSWVETAAPWIRPGGACEVMQGVNEHKGMLRLEANGDHVFTARNKRQRGRNSKPLTGNEPAARVSCLYLDPFPWIALVKRPPTPVDFKTGVTAGGVGWMELTLPGWAEDLYDLKPLTVPLPLRNQGATKELAKLPDPFFQKKRA